MKKLTLILALLVTSTSLASAASHRYSANDVYVQGYTRSNGTYVQPYYLSSPNAYKWDNYGYQPSQSQYNNSYYQPTREYKSGWYTPNPGRFSDNNPYNDAPGSGE